MVKNLPASAGDSRHMSLIHGSVGGDPLEVKMATHSSVPDLENSTDKGAWWATVHGVTKDLDMTEHSRLHTATTVYYRQGTSTLVL